MHIPKQMQPAPGAKSPTQPDLEHIAVWVTDIDRAAAQLEQAFGWRRHPLEFGVDAAQEVFGGMKLAFVDANGLWLELVEPTTPGPGMELLKEKGAGAIVELDFSVPDFDLSVDAATARGIAMIGMDGNPLKNGGLLVEWAIVDGQRVTGDERLAYYPLDVSRGTYVELFWEYPTGVVLRRDATWTDADRTPRSAPRFDHVTVVAADVAATSHFYGDVMNLARVQPAATLDRPRLGIEPAASVWFAANDRGGWIQVTGPASKDARAGVLASQGDGAVVELGAEVADLAALHRDLTAKGVKITSDGTSPLPSGATCVTTPLGDRYFYANPDSVGGMRILLFQRGTAECSAIAARDAAHRARG